MEIENAQNLPVQEKRWWEIELEMQENLQGKQDLRVRIDDPKTYLVNVTAACLLQESKYYTENDERRQIMTQALLKVAETDPEFVCQLGVYVRNELYIRTTSNYIAAFCVVHPKTQPFIEKYFNKIILLPNDLLETCEFAQVLYIFAATDFSNLHLEDYLKKNVRSELIFRNVLQRCVRSKFLEFNDYQLGKYCTDSQRKKKNFAYLAVTNVEKWKAVRAKKRSNLLAKIEIATKPEVLASSSDAVQASVAGIKKKIAKRGKGMKKVGKPARIPASTLEAKYLTFKDLIAFCHISKPKLRVFKILGKKYPTTAEDYAKTFSDVEVAKEPFDATKAGKRMKIEVSTTWETELSSKGNSALVWENLISSNQVPYLALIRNLSNILRAGVSDTAHNLVINKLQEPKAVENSKVFPLQFLSSIQAVNEAVSKGFKAKKDRNAPLAAQLESVKKFVEKDEETRMKEEEEATEAEQYIKVNPETGKLYIEALEKAIKVAVNKNLEEIQGNTAIFADVSGSMSTPISGGSRQYGTIRTCLDCALVLGLMIKQRSAKSSFYIFSSPGVEYKKCYLPVDLPGDDLNPSIQKLLEEKDKLGGGTDFPYECIDEWRQNKVHFDNVVILSDMMIAQGYSDIEVHGKSIVNSVQQYKNEVNPNLKIFAVDLESKGQCLNLGDEFNENNYIKIFGMSDSILKFISSKKGGFNQVEYVAEFALKKIAEKGTNQ